MEKIMRVHFATPFTTVTEFPGESDRRHNSRTLALFSLLYSSMDDGQRLIGAGIVTDLSPGGIGIRGNRSVTPGMRIALFVDLPGMEEPLCIAQSQVSWVAGHRFGVELEPQRLDEKTHLQFLLWDRVTPSDHDRCI
jgi:hypothetical protein